MEGRKASCCSVVTVERPLLEAFTKSDEVEGVVSGLSLAHPASCTTHIRTGASVPACGSNLNGGHSYDVYWVVVGLVAISIVRVYFEQRLVITKGCIIMAAWTLTWVPA